MVQATAAFSVVDPESGKVVTFEPGETVPDHVAQVVGEHVLDSKPDAPEENPFAGMNFDNADEALKAALEVASDQHDLDQETIEELTGKLETITAERDDLRSFKDTILSGNLEDLDLDALRTADEEAGPDAEQVAEELAKAADPDAPLFDPKDKHHTVVLKYLESADEAEDARVRAAEKAGRARPSILGDEG